MSFFQGATGEGLRGHEITQDMGNIGLVTYLSSTNEKPVCGR